VLSVPDDGPFRPVPTEPGPALHELPTGPEEPEVRWWAPRPGDPGCADLDPATPLPLLIVVDGEQHADQLGTPELVRRGISAGALPPLATVYVTSGPDRPDVLGVPDGHARWIAETLVPRLRSEGLHTSGEGPSQGAAVTVTSEPARTVLTGSSFGGLTTLFGVARAPEQIGVGIAQSVSLWRYAEGSLVRPLQLAARRAPVQLRLHAGRYEGTMPEQAGRLVEALRADGADATLEVFTGGHDWAWWQPMMLRELADLLG
jgi:enterochelin esterase family protein